MPYLCSSCPAARESDGKTRDGDEGKQTSRRTDKERTRKAKSLSPDAKSGAVSCQDRFSWQGCALSEWTEEKFFEMDKLNVVICSFFGRSTSCWYTRTHTHTAGLWLPSTCPFGQQLMTSSTTTTGQQCLVENKQRLLQQVLAVDKKQFSPVDLNSVFFFPVLLSSDPSRHCAGVWGTEANNSTTMRDWWRLRKTPVPLSLSLVCWSIFKIKTLLLFCWRFFEVVLSKVTLCVCVCVSSWVWNIIRPLRQVEKDFVEFRWWFWKEGWLFWMFESCV